MKTKLISIEVPEGKKVDWVNNVLTLVDDKISQGRGFTCRSQENS